MSTTTLSLLTEMVARFRTVTSIAALIEAAPREIARVGFERCLVSRVHQGRWIAQSAYVRGDADLARAITLAGSEAPVRLDRSLLESELVRTRAPMLVRDAQRHPRVHRRLVDVTASRTYVASPIQVGNVVVGFVHVDRGPSTGSVDEDDVELLGLITECLGSAWEQAARRERLAAMRLSMVSWSSALDLIEDPNAEFEPGLPSPLQLSPGPAPRSVSGGLRLATLTGRELQVLERIAAGDANADIAAALFITQATVKAHVKHIFRKLGVANRAEAVSTYLRR